MKTKSTKELLELRATLVNNARAIYDKAASDKRDPSAEETRQFDAMMADVDKIKDIVAEREQNQVRKDRLDAELRDLDTPRGPKSQMQQADKGERRDQPEVRTIEIRKGQTIELSGVRAGQDYSKAFRTYLMDGERTSFDVRSTLQQDSDTAGGFLVPELFSAELIQDLDNLVFMRRICRTITLRNAQSIGWPSLDTDLGDPTWTAELGTGSEDSSIAFGKREMKPYALARRVKASRTLLRNSAIPVEALIRQRFSYKFGTVMENAYLNGSGAGQPLGVFTASTIGIGTGRDVSTGNTDTLIKFDGLINALYSLKQQYRRNLNWIFHRDGVKQIRTLKDGEGRYIWEPSVRAGEPDTILNYPVNESEYAPSTFTSTLYVGIIGDFSQYWILDALDMEVQTLVELYAATNENGYIARMEGDGAPIDQNAFARVKLA